MNWTNHPFRDPLSGEIVKLRIGVNQETTGVEHPDCAGLADVSPELDCAFCSDCHWQCRISGAWFMDLIAAAWAS